MAATKADISSWFDRGLASGATHMVVVCDTYDWEDYPVYCYSEKEARKNSNDYSNMKKPMECYKLSDPKEEQLNERRCWRL